MKKNFFLSLLDSNILWKLPSQTVSVPDALMREVATPEMLQKLLNLYYIHNDMTNLLNSSLAHSLGIEKLATDHLLKIGEAIAASWVDITSGKSNLNFCLINSKINYIFFF